MTGHLLMLVYLETLLVAQNILPAT